MISKNLSVVMKHIHYYMFFLQSLYVFNKRFCYVCKFNVTRLIEVIGICYYIIIFSYNK